MPPRRKPATGLITRSHPAKSITATSEAPYLTNCALAETGRGMGDSPLDLADARMVRQGGRAREHGHGGAVAGVGAECATAEHAPQPNPLLLYWKFHLSATSLGNANGHAEAFNDDEPEPAGVAPHPQVSSLAAIVTIGILQVSNQRRRRRQSHRAGPHPSALPPPSLGTYISLRTLNNTIHLLTPKPNGAAHTLLLIWLCKMYFHILSTSAHIEICCNAHGIL
ncbi:hypothetical protein K438DRAFT_1945769 [Mycena galopus ATCC 62051]|nr:hypothetical protein K438DRAFT_1945769 [Mycena galopus ATCC 62051]